MNQDVLDYLQRQLSLGKQRLHRYVINPRGKAYAKRNIYIRTHSYIQGFLEGGYNQKRWVIIPGLRGTGKTTILAQTYYELTTTYGDAINLIYFSLDEVTETLGSNLNALLREYERLLGESYEVLSKPTFILIDEVQSDPNWAAVLKSLNERAAKVFLVCSGSSAVHIQDTADISGRRAVIEKLYPMNFCEFEMVQYGLYPDKGLKDEIKKALYGSIDGADCHRRLSLLQVRVDRYWANIDRRHWRYYLAAGSLPFALIERNISDVYDAVLASIDKVVTKDIQQLGRFTTETIPVIKRLLFILAESDAMSVTKLSSTLGVTAITITNILDTLVQTELLIRIPPHGSQIGAVKKPSKYLFMSPAIRAAFFNIAGSSGTSLTREGRLIEDVAGLHFYRELEASGKGSTSYDSSAAGADFIIKTGQSQIAVEIGRGSKTSKQVLSTMSRITCKYGLVISNEPLGTSKDETAVLVPRDFFALV